MSLPYAYTSRVWLPVIAVLLLIVLTVFSIRRSVVGALPFIFALLFGALWIVGINLEVAVVDASTKIFWVEYQTAWPGHWLTRRNLALLSIPCLLAFGLILTNGLHHLIWSGFGFDGDGIPLTGLRN